MSVSDAFKRCLETLDVHGARQLWQNTQPRLPQPRTDAEVLATLHVARTASKAVEFKLRAYSHRWCSDNGFPSQLPDELRPRAERVYPQVAEGVGLAALVTKPYTPLLRRAAEDAVLDIYASSKRPEPAVVRARIAEVRARERRKLGV